MGRAEAVIVGVIDGGQFGCVEEGSVGIFFIGFLLGYPDGILLGRVNRCELGASDGDSLRNVELAPDWLYGRGLGLKVRMGVNSGCQIKCSWEIFNWTPTR